MVRAVLFDMYETLITLYASPLYFSAQIAADAGVPEDQFRKTWRNAEKDRSIGKISLEGILEQILKENRCFSKTLLRRIIRKRIWAQEETYRHLHPEILPMLTELKENGIKIGLVSNCFSEESEVIRKSILFPYFDAVCLSYEEGVCKPDPEIFMRCLRKLGVEADECMYVGDGGSLELETALQLGMKPIQAVWYLKQGTGQPAQRKEGFLQAESPMGIINEI